MLFLFKIGFFEIDFSSIIAFLLGILLGCMVMALLYALLVVLSLGNKKYLIKPEDNSLSWEEIELKATEARKAFMDKGLRGEQSKITHLKNICGDLVLSIATSFYPNSKNPIGEISVEEGIMLISYVHDRINQIMDKKVMKLLKKYKIGSILEMTKSGTRLVDSKFFQVGVKVKGGIGTVMKGMNIINPAYWVRKVVTDNATKIIINEMGKAVIVIVAEEAYKIYSKSIFNKEVEIESTVDSYINDIDRQLNDLAIKSNNNEIAFDIESSQNEDLGYLPLYKKRIYTKEAKANLWESSFDDNMRYLEKNNAVEPMSILEEAVEEDDSFEEES